MGAWHPCRNSRVAGDAMDRASCQPLRVQVTAGQVIDSFLDVAGAITADGWQVTGVTDNPDGDGEAPGSSVPS